LLPSLYSTISLLASTITRESFSLSLAAFSGRGTILGTRRLLDESTKATSHSVQTILHVSIISSRLHRWRKCSKITSPPATGPIIRAALVHHDSSFQDGARLFSNMTSSFLTVAHQSNTTADRHDCSKYWQHSCTSENECHRRDGDVFQGDTKPRNRRINLPQRSTIAPDFLDVSSIGIQGINHLSVKICETVRFDCGIH
jgi:hypothetical protein